MNNKYILFKVFIVLFSIITISCNADENGGNSEKDNNEEGLSTESSFVPFAGNSYVINPIGSSFIDLYTGRFQSDWIDSNIRMASYFRVGKKGRLIIDVLAYNKSGSSDIAFTVNGKKTIVKISETNYYPIAEIQMEKAGYVKIEIEAISKSGDNYGVINGFRIDGIAASGINNYATKIQMDKDKLNTYWFRRGASVHFNYIMPSENVEYFYNEVLVNEADAVRGSYYMVNGFSEGYMGIQIKSNGSHTVLFSVWSPYTTDDPTEIPEDQRIQLLRKGKNVDVNDFGHEGSGAQSWFNYNWKPDEKYASLIRVRPMGQDKTEYTAYFYAEGRWNLIASFLRPKTNKFLTGSHSFLENFDPIYSIFSRSVSFGNQWAYTASGSWVEITDANFTCDDTGRNGIRYDYSGVVDVNTNMFVLKSFGFTNDHTEYGTRMRRKVIGIPPEIDFSALE